MRLFIPRKPSKPGARLSVWMMLFGNEMPFGSTPTVKVRCSGGTYFWDAIFQSSAGGGGSMSGLQFQQPYVELDPTLAVAQWTIVNISPNNPMVTTGQKDAVSGLIVKAPVGYWVAVVDVLAQAGSPAAYNVPVMPPVVAWTSSPGSQKGDLDQAGIFWWPLPRMSSICV